VLNKLVEKYFSILDDYFGDAVDWMTKKQYSKNEQIRAIAETYDATLFKPMLDSLYEELRKLDWASQEKVIKNIGGSKTAYIESSYVQSSIVEDSLAFLKKIALYSDTIIIDDPIGSELIACRNRKGIGVEQSFALIAQMAINYLSIKDLFLSDLQPQICTLAPSMLLSVEKLELKEAISNIIYRNLISYSSEVFGKVFRSKNELETFLVKIKDFSEFVSLAKKPEMISTITGDPFTITHYLHHKNYWEKKYARTLTQSELLSAILRNGITRVTLPLITNGRFTSSYVTDLKGDWDILNWVIKKDNEAILKNARKKLFSKDALILNALQQEELKWLGNVPVDVIGKLRERGELQELREIIGRNVQDLENVTDEDFVEVGQQVKYNLNQAFKKHNAEVNDLNKTYKRKYKISVPSLIVSGSLGIFSALYPPISQALGITSSIVGGGSVLKLINDFVNKREKMEELQKKPVAMLFNVKNVE